MLVEGSWLSLEVSDGGVHESVPHGGDVTLGGLHRHGDVPADVVEVESCVSEWPQVEPGDVPELGSGDGASDDALAVGEVILELPGELEELVGELGRVILVLVGDLDSDEVTVKGHLGVFRCPLGVPGAEAGVAFSVVVAVGGHHLVELASVEVNGLVAENRGGALLGSGE